MNVFEDHGNDLCSDVGFLWRDSDGFVHIHPHYELMICTTPAKMEFTICGHRLQSEYPAAILVAPFMPHFMSAIDVGRSPRMVMYFGKQVWDRSGFYQSPDVFLEKGAARVFDLSRCFGTVQNMLKLYQNLRTPWQKEQQLALILDVFWQGREKSQVVMNILDDYILKVIDHITHHLNEKMTIDSLAAKFFVSRDKLKKDFKRSTYNNIGDFIQYMRLNQAKELLRNRPDMPIADVISSCGYESTSYFHKIFKKATGETPLRYQSHG